MIDFLYIFSPFIYVSCFFLLFLIRSFLITWSIFLQVTRKIIKNFKKILKFFFEKYSNKKILKHWIISYYFLKVSIFSVPLGYKKIIIKTLKANNKFIQNCWRTLEEHFCKYWKIFLANALYFFVLAFYLFNRKRRSENFPP